MSKREQIANVYGLDTMEGLIFLEPEYLDDAIIGLGQRINTAAIVYSEPCIIRLLQKHDGMTMDDAVEHFNFNIAGGWLGEASPIFVDNEVFE